jgi:hypothetical protein
MVKTVMKLKNNKSTVFTGGGPMLLQHNKARHYTSAAASAVINSTGSKVIPHLPIGWIWHCDFWIFFASLKKHLKGSHFTHNKAFQPDTEKLFQGQPEE